MALLCVAVAVVVLARAADVRARVVLDAADVAADAMLFVVCC